MYRKLRRLLAGFREFNATQTELAERQDLLNRPWEEELLHWSYDGRLHGHIAPPPDGRRRSTTRDGWCIALREWPRTDTASSGTG